MVSMIHKLYQSTIDVKNNPEYCEKKIPRALRLIKIIIDRKNTAIPLLKILQRSAISMAKIIIGKSVIIYEIIILINKVVLTIFRKNNNYFIIVFICLQSTPNLNSGLVSGFSGVILILEKLIFRA